MASQKDVAAHLDLSDRGVRDLAARGIIPNGGRGVWDLDACRIAYITHLREISAGRRSADGDGEDLDLVTERARLAKAQADAQEMKNALTRGDLIPRPEIVASMQTVFASVRARLLAIPNKGASMVCGLRQLPEIKEQLTVLVHEALAELSARRVVSETPGEPGDGGRDQRRDDGLDATATPDGERVGRPKPRPKPRSKR